MGGRAEPQAAMSGPGAFRRASGGDVPGIEEVVVRGSMTKAVLVEEVARVADLTKKDAEVIVDTVFGCIVDALHRGEKIELRGFGSFRLREREPRKGRNPKTGDRVDVPPKKVPYFKPGKELKELINRGPEKSARPLAAAAPAPQTAAVPGPAPSGRRHVVLAGTPPQRPALPARG